MRRIGKKLTGWCPRGQYVTPEWVPFQERLPLTLKDKVSGKGGKDSSVACLQEMSVLFACLKRHDFKEDPCSAEISKFQSCFNTHTAQKKARKELERKGLFTPGEKRLSHKQATSLLKKFPNN